MDDSDAPYRRASAETCRAAIRLYAEYWRRNVNAPILGQGLGFRLDESANRQFGPNGAWRGQFGLDATRRALLYLSGSRDHLIGLSLLLDHHPDGLTIGPAARSAVEAAGRSAWVVGHDLEVESNTRRLVARLCIDEERDARDYLALLKFGQDQNDIRRAARRHVSARRNLREDGMFYKKSEIQIDEKKRFRSLCGEVAPTLSDLAVSVLAPSGEGRDAAQFAYSYMSDMTHSSYSVVRDNIDTPAAGAEWFWPFKSNPLFGAKAVTAAVSAFLYAWSEVIDWTGLDSEEHIEVQERHAELCDLIEQ